MAASTALPNETWLEIFSYCSKGDLKALRLTSENKFEMLASKLLFTTAYVAARRGVLDIFMKLTTHPIFCHYITKLVYDISYFENPLGSFVIGNFQRTTGGTHLRSFQDPRIHTLFEDQEQIQSKELFDCLKSAFSGLSHLRQVVVADLSGTPGLLGDVIDLDGSPLNKRLYSKTIEDKAYGTGFCCVNGRGLDCGYHGSTYRRQFGGVVQLIQVLADSDLPSFDSLSLGTSIHSFYPHSDIHNYTRPRYGGISNWCLHQASGLHFELRQNVLPRLRTLDLTICVDTAFEPNETPPRSSKTDLYILLDKASELEVLKLTGHVNSAPLNVHDVLPASGLSKLRVLEMKACEARYHELTNFFVHCKDRLRRIKLDDFNLLDGTWEELKTFMPLNLPETSLIWGFTWEHGRPPTCADDKISDEGNWDNVLFGTEYQYLDEENGEWAGIDDDGSIWAEDLDYDSGSDHEDLDYESGSDHEDINLELLREGVVNYTNSPHVL